MRLRIQVDPDRSGLRNGAVRSVGWAALEKAGTRAGSFLTFLVLARLLAPEAFGLVALASAFVTIISLLFDLNLTHYLVQQVELHKRVINTAFWTSMALGMAVTAAIATSAPLIAGLLNEPRLTLILIALAGTVPLGSMTAVPQALLRRSLAFDVISTRGLAGIVVSGVVGIGLALAGAGVWALVAQMYAQNLTSLVLFFGLANWRPQFAWDRRESGVMLRYGLNLWGMGFLQFIQTRGDEFIVGVMLGSTNLGIYSIAKRIVLFVCDLFGGVVLHVMPSLLAAAKTDPDRVRRGYLMGIAAASAVVGPVTLGLASVSGLLVPLLFGPQWQESGLVAQVVGLGALVIVLIQVDRGLFLALDLPRIELRTMAITSVIAVGLSVAATNFGLIAFATTMTVWGYLAWAWRVNVVRTHARIPARTILGTVFPIWLSALLSALLAWVVVIATDEWADLYSIGAAGLVLTFTYPPLLRLLARPSARMLRDLSPAFVERHTATRLLLRCLLGKTVPRAPVPE